MWVFGPQQLTYETNSVDGGVRWISSSNGRQTGRGFFTSEVLSRLRKLRVQTVQLWHLMQEAKLSWMLERLQFGVIQLNGRGDPTAAAQKPWAFMYEVEEARFK